MNGNNIDWLRPGLGLFALVAIAATGVVFVACGGSKQIHRYQPQALQNKIKASPSGASSDVVLAVENFSAGAGYDEQRIVYRSDAYRFDYYHFHRWAAPPGMLVADVLREVYRGTGAFRSVVSGYAARADVVLSGRVIAFEEIDESKKKWLANVVLDLRLRDAKTGQLIWTDTIQKKNKLQEQSPSGLAAALSEALTEIGLQTADTLAENASSALQRRRRERNSGKGGSGMLKGDGGSGSSSPPVE